MLSEEETLEIKQKIISHIEKNFPEEQIEQAKSQIENMASPQLEKFLEDNKILIENSDNNCIFCSIASGKINSIKIGENNEAIAILEINPISRGHAIIIPKEHSRQIDKEIYSFADEIAEKIKSKLKPKRIESSKSKFFGHEIINLLPVYEDETINSPKKHAEFVDLEKIREELEKEEEQIPVPIPIEKKEEFLWLPKRIP